MAGNPSAALDCQANGWSITRDANSRADGSTLVNASKMTGHGALQQKVVLITGGTGSFGKTMTRALIDGGEVGEVRIFSRDEEKQDAMRNSLRDPRLRYYIGDIRDRASLDQAMSGVDYVFHAAALKQVPSCEFFPMQAVQTNVLGSSNVLLSAIAHHVRSVVCLSTDKAVFPVNAMGMTKALMEKTAQSLARSPELSGDTVISCVRYGNVMYSRGSVIPLFIKQVQAEEAVTVTEPSMTRFLMPLADSVELVLHAFGNARPGDTFIKKAPAARIDTLISAIHDLFLATNRKVQTIGIRHGEKLHETLASSAELARAEDQGAYFRIRMDGRELNYAEFFSAGDTTIPSIEDYNSMNTHQLDVEGVKSLLLRLPEIQALLNVR